MIALLHVRSAIGALLAPRANWGAIRQCATTLWKHRRLSLEIVKRDLGGQYAGQVFGSFWILGHPLILFVVYTVLFGYIMRVRLEQNVEMPRDYTTYILTGLAPWLSIQLGLTRSPNALLAQANLVKQVVFPIEVLPFGAIVAATIPLAIGIVVVVFRTLVLDGSLPPMLLLLPVAAALHIIAMLGLGYLLAAITPFFRDIKDIIAVLTVIGVYLVPAFYLPSWVPSVLRIWLYLNPFSYIIWMYQDVLYFGEIRHPWAWGVSFAMAFVGLALGFRAFRRLKPFVANVL
ncbi:lipopolysaccharide transport system permease protein [Bradyrhizobium macuxiense]|uniref:Transport permease protein n=2 Tax=Bradyrhizobium macuxiense TaxID=1755647 RepID=A0A560LUM8_9BRAD|nr:lipopolysaccharide transport system permease protein [Bradyrhizobium macuxiense]